MPSEFKKSKTERSVPIYCHKPFSRNKLRKRIKIEDSGIWMSFRPAREHWLTFEQAVWSLGNQILDQFPILHHVRNAPSEPTRNLIPGPALMQEKSSPQIQKRMGEKFDSSPIRSQAHSNSVIRTDSAGQFCWVNSRPGSSSEDPRSFKLNFWSP